MSFFSLCYRSQANGPVRVSRRIRAAALLQLIQVSFNYYYTVFHVFSIFLFIRNELKITLVLHLKYATDEDLKQVGLSKPEIRRLRKFYEKIYPHGYLSKIKRLLHNPGGIGGSGTRREEGPVSILFYLL